MKLLVTLQRSGGIEGLARQAGLPVERAASLSEGLLPGLMFAMRGYVRAHGGGERGVRVLLDAIETQGAGAMAAQVLSHDPADPGPGHRLLDQLFAGGAALADAPADALGPDGEAVLPLLTMLVSGYVAAQAGGSGAQGSGGLNNLGPVLDFLTTELGVEDARRLL